MNVKLIALTATIFLAQSVCAVDGDGAVPAGGHHKHAMVLGVLGAGAVAMTANSEPVRKVLETTLRVPAEVIEVMVGTLTALGAMGLFGSPEAMYMAKWGVLLSALALGVNSYPGQYFLNHVPLLGKSLISDEELTRMRDGGVSNQELAARFSSTFVTTAFFAALQRFLIKNYTDQVGRLGMMPPA